MINPFSEDADKWIDWLGRVLIVCISLGQVICAAIAYSLEITQTFTPSLGMLANYSVPANGSAGVYVIVDIMMVGLVYTYVFGILHYLGIFDSIQRFIRYLYIYIYTSGFNINDYIYIMIIGILILL